MPDQFIENTTLGFGARIGKSIQGLFFGILLFLASFVLLYWNEGRVDLSKIAKTAIEASSAQTGTPTAAQLVYTTGEVTTEEKLADGLFLQAGPYLAIERRAEMYSWIEKTDSKTKSNTGGSETTEKTYTYVKEWKETPEASSSFKLPDGHQNPAKKFQSGTEKVTTATIGNYTVSPKTLSLPPFEPLSLNEENSVEMENAVRVNDSYFFLNKSGVGTLEDPQIGDERISYLVLYTGTRGTVFGALQGNDITPFVNQNGTRLYRLFTGTKDEAVATLHTEYTTSLLVLRIVGFLMMWIGLSMFFAPITTLIDILPILGGLSRMLVGIITFVVAIILTTVTIIVSMLLHNVVALVIAIIATVGGLLALSVFFKKSRSSDSTPPATPSTPTSTSPSSAATMPPAPAAPVSSAPVASVPAANAPAQPPTSFQQFPGVVPSVVPGALPPAASETVMNASSSPSPEISSVQELNQAPVVNPFPVVNPVPVLSPEPISNPIPEAPKAPVEPVTFTAPPTTTST